MVLIDSIIDKRPIQLQYVTPFQDGVYFTINFYESVIAFVQALFCLSYPSAIIWRIITIIVYPIYNCPLGASSSYPFSMAHL